MIRHMRVFGRVHGVGFRHGLMTEANRAGVTGWVRNCGDGSVEAMLDGPPDRVEALIAWARRGPPAAQVSSVQLDDGEGSYGEFEIWPDQ